jgi:hypothetical protein
MAWDFLITGCFTVECQTDSLRISMSHEKVDLRKANQNNVIQLEV